MAITLPESEFKQLTLQTQSLQPPSSVPLSSPLAGSANPAASLPALWSYIVPALNHIVCSPTSTLTKAPALTVEYHAGIYTAVYNYFAQHWQVESDSSSTGPSTAAVPAALTAIPGYNIYKQLDLYYARVCEDLRLNTPEDDCELIRYIIASFNRYSAGVDSVHRLLNQINRSFVKRAVERDNGWHRSSDIFCAIVQTIESGKEIKLADIWHKQREVRLKKWGLVDGASATQIAQAEASAEAASPLDRIVPLSSIARRRFRTEVLEPLLLVSDAIKKPKGKAKGNRKRIDAADIPFVGQKGRLARAINLLETKDGQGLAEETKELARSLDIIFCSSGIKGDQIVRRKLKRLAAH